MTEGVIVSIIAALTSIAGSYLLARNERRKASAANEIDLERLQREIRAELWDDLRESLENSEKKRKDQEQRIDTLAERTRNLEAENSSFLREINELRDRVKHLEAENDHLRRDNMALLSELSLYSKNRL